MKEEEREGKGMRERGAVKKDLQAGKIRTCLAHVKPKRGSRTDSEREGDARQQGR